ncbi:MAG: YaaR family protein [Candidatus Goldbacteria bacterium]|nr:YaaR family protein [Candidatus Goldiibacteriota bacterium]
MRVFDAAGMPHDKNVGGTGRNKKAEEKRGTKFIARDKVNEMNFMKQLTDATEDQVKKNLDQLIEELSEQAKVLVKRRTFTELDKYKSLVKNFMKKAVETMYTVKFSDSSKVMARRKKVYVLVEKVDEELEKLTAQILNSQEETLDLLATIDRIRGILVDMYS